LPCSGGASTAGPAHTPLTARWGVVALNFRFFQPHWGQSEISLEATRSECITVLNFDLTPKLCPALRVEEKNLRAPTLLAARLWAGRRARI